MNTAGVQFTVPLFITTITQRALVPVASINVELLVLWVRVQFPRMRGLIDWKWLVEAIAYLVFGGRSSVDAINGRPDDRSHVFQLCACHPIRGMY